MGKNQRKIYSENDDAWNSEIQKVLGLFPDNAWKDLSELVKEMKDDGSPDAITAPDTPIQKKWEMIYFIAPGAHLWELIRLPNGNYTLDEQGDISDITLQVYSNGWIFRVVTALDVEAVYSPTAIRKIKVYSDKIHEQDRKFREKYNKLIAQAAESEGLFDRVYVRICQNAVKAAKCLETEPIDEIELQAARMGKYTWQIYDELDRVYPSE